MPNNKPQARINRRGILHAGMLALGGLSLPSLLQMRAVAEADATRSDTSVIFLFLHGGPSQLETYDLKPDAPSDVRGPFGPMSPEPVGSCTDLVATVIRPLTEVYGVPLDIAPYGVILKPSDGLRILRGEATSGFSPKANYIFRKQIEEADFVVINRVDELSAADVSELQSLIEKEYLRRSDGKRDEYTYVA